MASPAPAACAAIVFLASGMMLFGGISSLVAYSAHGNTILHFDLAAAPGCVFSAPTHANVSRWESIGRGAGDGSGRQRICADEYTYNVSWSKTANGPEFTDSYTEHTEVAQEASITPPPCAVPPATYKADQAVQCWIPGPEADMPLMHTLYPTCITRSCVMLTDPAAAHADGLSMAQFECIFSGLMLLISGAAAAYFIRAYLQPPNPGEAAPLKG